MLDRRVAGGIAIALVLALAFWLLFLRTPDGAKRASTKSPDRALTPTFPALTGDASSSAATSDTPSTVTTTTLVGETTVSVQEPTTSARTTDPVGDRTFSVDPPPPWADLAGATLTRSSDGYELRVQLGGGAAPSTTDAGHTMNIASFYDVDGDGSIDFEVWGNLAENGWGSSYFDDAHDFAVYGADSFVTVAAEGDAVVFRFPLAHLLRASTFRWSVASEWGTQAVIGTQLAARDDAPDNDAPAPFPD